MGPTRHYDLASELIEQGHEVLIFAGNYCHNTFQIIAEPFCITKKIAYYGKVPFIWFDAPSYKKNSLKRLWNMLVFAYKLITSKEINDLPKPDIIIGSSPSPFAAYSAYRLAGRFNVSFVYEIRDLWPQTLLRLGKFSPYHPLVVFLQIIENILIKKSKKIISVLPGVKDYLVDKKILHGKLIWIPNFVDIKHINYKAMSVNNCIIVLYAGSFNVANDVETLLHAAKILQELYPKKFSIQLIGEGPMKQNLVELVKQQRIKNVEFLPTVAKEQIHTVLASADILVGLVRKTSLYRWGTSLNKISDYLAAARPIIFALDSPYSPIEEANAGLTVAPENPIALADAILNLSAMSPAEREQLGLNGRRYAEEKYNLQVLANRLLTVFQQVIEQNQNSSLRK